MQGHHQVHHQHHHLHNPGEFIEGHEGTKLAMVGLGIATGIFGPIVLAVAGGAGAVAGAGWLIARARERSLDTSH